MIRPFEQEQASLSDRLIDVVILLGALAVIGAILSGWLA